MRWETLEADIKVWCLFYEARYLSYRVCSSVRIYPPWIDEARFSPIGDMILEYYLAAIWEMVSQIDLHRFGKRWKFLLGQFLPPAQGVTMTEYVRSDGRRYWVVGGVVYYSRTLAIQTLQSR